MPCQASLRTRVAQLSFVEHRAWPGGQVSGPTARKCVRRKSRKRVFGAADAWAPSRCAGHTYAEPVLGLPGALPVPALGRPLGGVSVFKGFASASAEGYNSGCAPLDGLFGCRRAGRLPPCHGIDCAEVRDVVAEVGHRARVDGREPDGVDPERGHVVQPRGDAPDVSDAVAVGVLDERGWIWLGGHLFSRAETGKKGITG
jgi:hypothetical protein